MSLIDSKNVETGITEASMNSLANVLKQNGYQVVHTKLMITATKKSFWTSTTSTITIIDKGDYRQCEDVETSKGYMMRPNTGELAKIIKEAEGAE